MPEDLHDKLIGTWVTDPSDTDAIKEYGRATIVFSREGKLTYIIQHNEKEEVIMMTYYIDDSVLVTDQPSQPSQERTAFTIASDGKLVLDYGGSKSIYVRVRD